MKKYDKRTLQQNKALWKYFELLAEALNDAGLDMRKTLKPDIEIPWTKNSIHDHLWLPIQETMYGKGSTTELNTIEPSEIHAVLSRHLGERFGLFVAWPENQGQEDK